MYEIFEMKRLVKKENNCKDENGKWIANRGLQELKKTKI